MKRSLMWFAVLVAMLAASACAQYAKVASRAVSTIGAAELTIARAGVDAHKAEVVAVIEDARAKRAALGCGAAGSAVPPGCDTAAWDEYRTAAGEKLDAAKKRYEAFALALRTLDAALTETALSVKVYLETNGEFDLAGSVASLVKAWSTAAAIAKEYGVSVPTVEGLR